MKILYCIPWLYNAGGMERTLTTKVNYLVAHLGYEVTIVTTEQYGRAVYFELDKRVQLIHLDIKQEEQPMNSSFFKRKAHQKQLAGVYRKQLEKILMQNPQDFVVSMMKGDEFDFLPDLKDKSVKIAECHYATQFYDSFHSYQGANLLKKIWRKYQRAHFLNTLKRYEKVVVLTKADLDNWCQFIDNLSQVYNPLDFKIEETLVDYGKKSVIAVGRLSPEKGYPELLSVWKEVLKAYPDWTLNIYGSGPEAHKLLHIIEEKDLKASVAIHAPFTPIAEKMSQSSIFVMASHKEGMGLSLVEAMECGLPVMAFNCENGPREIIDDGINGYLIDDFDLSAYAQHLKALMADQTLRKQLGAAAKLRAKAFSAEAIMGIWHQVFNESIKKMK